MKALTFDITPCEIPVSIAGVEYVLREASGAVACKFRDAQMRCMRLGPKGVVGINEGLAETEALLVSLCLVSKEGAPVSQETVKSWPPRVVATLFAKAKEISGLNEDEDLAALIEQRKELDRRIANLQQGGTGKNSPDGSTVGSE